MRQLLAAAAVEVRLPPQCWLFKHELDHIRDRETLVVSNFDRRERNAQDVGATIKALTARNIKAIVLQLGALDLTSPAGKLMLTIGPRDRSVSLAGSRDCAWSIA